MKNYYNKLINAHNYINSKIESKPKIGVVLGSGLGTFAEKIEITCTVSYNDIPDFPVSTVEGHTGQFVFGRVGNIEVVLMQGRVHYYEGYDMSDVVMPVRLMGLLGVKKLILTNAAGGISESLKTGSFMAITDHISSFVPSPLVGENIDKLGVRFPDMSEVYSKKMIECLMLVANKFGISLEKGIYLQTTGPNYETPAEIKMFKMLGADVVGMSTVCEAIAAKHMGIEICGVSCVTNMASGISDAPLSHSEVKDTANKVSKNFEKLIYNFILKIGENL